MRAGVLSLLLVACGTPSGGPPRADKPVKASAPRLTAHGARSCWVHGGRARCWGSNAQGGLRPDAPPAVRRPLLVPFGPEVRQALPLEAATCALRADGAVDCLGIHPRSILRTEGFDGARQLAGGRGYACALEADGAVSCWGVGAPGANRRHARFEVEGLDDAVQIAAGESFVCALRRRGAVVCWGDNRFGQLGDGSTQAHDTPAPTAYRGDDVVEIAAGDAHACLRTASGEVRCWGRDDRGQVGGGRLEGGDSVAEPTVVPELARATRLAAGGDTTCAAVEQGVVCWGDGRCGQRGVAPARGCAQLHPDPDDRAPRLALSGAVDELAMGSDHVCALRDAEVLCWGLNDMGQLGRGATEGLTRQGRCHPRAALCASEEPLPVAEPVADPGALPRGEGIPWEPPLGFGDAPRPPPHEVAFEVREAEGFTPAPLTELLQLTLRGPALSCYRRLGPEPPARVVELTVEERGEAQPEVAVVGDGLEPLARCLRAMVARGYFSVEGEGSFRVRARFTPTGWDGTM